MSPTARLALLLIALLLPTSWAEAEERRLAITIDDLPWQQIGASPAASVASQHAALIAELRAAGVPATGFVNEDKLEREGRLQPEREAMLRDWLDAGMELGNHTYGHVDLHAVGLPAYQEAILRGERVLRPLLAERGQVPRWFRHPYLRAGQSAEDKAGLERFLADRGYRIAPVTVDNSEWIFAFAYRRVLDGEVAADTRDAQLQRLRETYLAYMLDKLDYYARFSQALLGYELPQILLLHANAINAHSYAALVAAIRARGYRIVGLDEAMQDPAYARADGYFGRWGPSWLHRWAIAEKRPREFFAGEPHTPDWVMALAGVESE